MKDEAVLNILITKNLIPGIGTFEVTNSLIDQFYYEYNILYNSKNVKQKKSNINYAKKLAALSLIKLNKTRESSNSVTGSKPRTKIKSGFIYIISNPIFPNMFKIGITRDINSRLQTYQTYDPLRRYKIEHYFFCTNIRDVESKVLNNLQFDIVKGEWLSIPLEEIQNKIKQVIGV